MLEDLIPLWYDHVRDQDQEHGPFYLNLSRDWQPQPPWDQIPAMISRQVFAFSAAYLLSGDSRYLDTAQGAVRYLLDHGWDKEYGGWYNSLTQSGAPQDSSKGVGLQLYTNVGLALYYFATGDEEVRSRIDASLAIRQSRGRDEEFGGFYYALTRDLSVKDDVKVKHAHYGYVGSLIHYYLATRDAGFLQFERELMDLTAERMMDPDLGWVYGYEVPFDRQWRPIASRDKGYVPIGAQLTTALAFLRLHQQSGDARYLELGEGLGRVAIDRGWDSESGAWLDRVGRHAPFAPVPEAKVAWWIQIYGSFLQLHLYHATHDPACLERFRKMEAFFARHMIDSEFGGVFETVSPNGEIAGRDSKATAWHTSYHDTEHGLLNYLYLNLYVNEKPAVLHFRFDGGTSPRKRFVSLVDDPSVTVSAVKVNGQAWADFDAAERSVTLPAGEKLEVQVTLIPAE